MLSKEARFKYGRLKWEMILHTSADSGHTKIYRCEEIDGNRSVFTPVTNYVEGKDMERCRKEFGEEQIIYWIGKGDNLSRAEFCELLNTLEVEVESIHP